MMLWLWHLQFSKDCECLFTELLYNGADVIFLDFFSNTLLYTLVHIEYNITILNIASFPPLNVNLKIKPHYIDTAYFNLTIQLYLLW